MHLSFNQDVFWIIFGLAAWAVTRFRKTMQKIDKGGERADERGGARGASRSADSVLAPGIGKAPGGAYTERQAAPTGAVPTMDARQRRWDPSGATRAAAAARADVRTQTAARIQAAADVRAAREARQAAPGWRLPPGTLMTPAARPAELPFDVLLGGDAAQGGQASSSAQILAPGELTIARPPTEEFIAENADADEALPSGSESAVAPVYGLAPAARPGAAWLQTLKEPATARRAILLREILGPPVGLR